MSQEITSVYDGLTSSYNFQQLSNAFQAIFPNPDDFCNWVYADGVDITRYLIALEEADSVKSITKMITSILKENDYSKLVTSIEKDKTASKFIEKWIKSQGVHSSVIVAFNNMGLRNRNIYSYFMTVLIKYSVVSTAK